MNRPLDKWELLAQLLEAQASDYRASVKLWETDPEKYGAGPHHDFSGQATGLKHAAEMIRRVVDAEGAS